MIALFLLCIVLSALSGVLFCLSSIEDEPGAFLVGAIVFIVAFCLGIVSYNEHERKMMNYETKYPPQVDTTVTINPDKTIDTMYTYHFPQE